LLDGLSKPKDIAKRCLAIQSRGAALTDHGNVSGAIDFSKEMRSKGLKPIIGCEFYVCKNDSNNKKEENRSLSHILLLAMNIKGWHELIEITSTANAKESFYYKPRLSIDEISTLPHDNIIAISGHFGSTLTEMFYKDAKFAGTSRSMLEAKKFLNNDMDFRVKKHLGMLREIFKDRFFVEIQLVDKDINYAAHTQALYLRKFAADLKLNTVATPDAHYAEQTDAILQRILLCTSLGNTTFAEVRKKLSNKENIPLSAFFNTSTYHIPSYDEMIMFGNSKEELATTILVADMCEDYDLTRKPMLPKFDCPDNMDSMDYIRQLCREGYTQRENLINKVIASRKATKSDYGKRFEKEFTVLKNAGLGDYFLIVRDFVDYARRSDILVGAGRGSAAGSLILYLLGVTHVDPLEYDLLFERFYNAGRNTKDRISLPDVDMDFEKERRGDIINYIKTRFGEDKVSHVITFNRMQGKSALKDVLRTRNTCDFSQMNRITEFIPSEEEIKDQLQDMKEATGEASIIRWSLENHAKELNEWAYLDDRGDVQGEMANDFKLAIAIEGTKRSQGKHAAGIVISSEPLRKVCPMVYDSKSEKPIAGMEMDALADAGHVKFDIMGVAMLDKVHGIQNLLSTGRL